MAPLPETAEEDPGTIRRMAEQRVREEAQRTAAWPASLDREAAGKFREAVIALVARALEGSTARERDMWCR